MSNDWNEELVSVVTDYRIGWRQAEGRQPAIDLLMRSAGGGGGCGVGKHGLYRATAVSKPRLAQPTLTDAEAETLRELRDEAAQYADEIGLCASEVRGRQRIIDGLLVRLGGEQ